MADPSGGAVEAEQSNGVHKEGFWALALGSVGVVFGDIGTSPLYAFKETFSESHGLPLDRAHILDVLSLIFWTLMIVVTIKYICFLLKADNKGEGGSFALQALAAVKAPELAERLRASLQAEDFVERATAAELVGQTRPADGVALLVRAFE